MILWQRTWFAARYCVLFSLQSLQCHNNNHNIIYSKCVVWWFLLNKMDTNYFFWQTNILIFFHIFISQNLFFWNFNILKQLNTPNNTFGPYKRSPKFNFLPHFREGVLSMGATGAGKMRCLEYWGGWVVV